MTATRVPPALPAAEGPDRGRSRTVPRGLLLAGALFVAGVLISAFTIRQGVSPLDEGLALQAARRITQGQVPYRDFTTAYGPLQPYVLALLFKLFGVSLMQWRVLRVLSDGATALVVYLLVRPYVPRPLALVAWLEVACALASPRASDPYQFVLLPILLGLLVATRGELNRRRLFGAALLVAVALALRIDFGLYGLAALGAVIIARGRLRSVPFYVASAVVVAGLVYLPFAILAGPGTLYENLIGRSLRTGSYWTLPFPLHFRHARGSSLSDLARAAADELSFYTPLLLLIGAGLATAALIAAWWRDRRPSPLALGLCVLGAGSVAFLLSRPDSAHAHPLYVVVVLLLALAIGGVRGVGAWVCALVLALVVANGVIGRASSLVHPPRLSEVHVSVAEGAEAAPREARAIERMVAVVDSVDHPGQPIYVLPRRSDLITLADPLIYVLTQRPNPTGTDFGLLTGRADQDRIVSVLSRVRPRVIVRWTDPVSDSPEPNRRGRSSGVHTLDDWVAGHYRLLARLYHYDVLTPR